MPLSISRSVPALLAGLALSLSALAQPVQLGAGTYHLAPKGKDKPMPPAPFRTADMLKRAAPTNQWYSTLVFAEKPEALFVQPITAKATAAGLEGRWSSRCALPERDRISVPPAA